MSLRTAGLIFGWRAKTLTVRLLVCSMDIQARTKRLARRLSRAVIYRLRILSKTGVRSAPYSISRSICIPLLRSAAATEEAVNFPPLSAALRSISAFTLGSTQSVSCVVLLLGTVGFCDRGFLVVIVCARMGMSDRAGWGEAMRARVFARLSCLTQTVPEDPLHQCQHLPTLRAIQHFEKQSCEEAAE
jgi:hypothetical protein